MTRLDGRIGWPSGNVGVYSASELLRGSLCGRRKSVLRGKVSMRVDGSAAMWSEQAELGLPVLGQSALAAAWSRAADTGTARWRVRPTRRAAWRLVLAIGVGLGWASPGALGAPAYDYDILNGSGQASGGTYNYWDTTYSGAGNTMVDGAPLIGGHGKLTDGVISTEPWYLTANTAGLGPDVGWQQSVTPNPKVVFPNIFADTGPDLHPVRVDITIWLDNSEVGGVAAPQSIYVDFANVPFVPPPLGSYGPVVLPSLLVPNDLIFTIEFIPQPDFPWIFVSEIGVTVQAPEPASVGLFGLGLLGLLTLRRRNIEA
jgi:PEP-CTERM motif